MNKVLTILSLVSLSLTAAAADFPVGTFSCKTDGTIRTITVSEIDLAGNSMPLVEITGFGTTPRKGIATLSKVSSVTTHLVLPAGASWNNYFIFVSNRLVAIGVDNSAIKCEQ